MTGTRASARARTHLHRWLGVLGIPLFAGMGACSLLGHHSSPWEFGPGVRLAPGLWAVGDQGATAHPVLGYTYLSYDGGHESLWEVGAQVRKPTSLFGDRGDRQPWLGGEATFSLLRDSYSFDGMDFSESNGGVSGTVLVGAPIGDGRWGPQIYGGFGLSHYGSLGINLRAGVDLQPWFIKR